MAETTVLFFLSLLAVSFLYLTYKFNDRIWGVVAGLLLMLLGLIVVSSGVQYDTGQTLNQTAIGSVLKHFKL